MQLFYFKEPKEEITLSRDESSHIIKVLRKKEGDHLNITDGQGYLYDSQITYADKRECKLKILSSEKKPKQHRGYLHIAIAPTKNISRFEWFLEKSTEIGINEITPIICVNSERTSINYERCERILISAIKQSKKYHLPKFNKATNFNEIIQSDANKAKYIAHCQVGEKVLLSSQKFSKKTIILIGPEGDFSKDEIGLALKNEFQPISLGESRLRTETAGIVACTIANLNYEK